jgi:hypothetical protein
MSPATTPGDNQVYQVLAKWHRYNALLAFLARDFSVTLINDLYLDHSFLLY